MKEELKTQIEKLKEDPQFIELLEAMEDEDITEAELAEMYIMQENPFAEVEEE